MSSLFNQASLVLVPSGYKAGKVYSQVPTNGDGDLTFTRASDATRVNSAGLIEKVRTNLFTYSEEFDNAAWVKQTDTTISSNATTSPYGDTNADKLINSTSVNRQAIYQDSSLTGVLSFSVFAKKAEYDVIQLTDGRNPTFFANFDLTNGVLGSVVGFTASIQDYGNGWYRCAVSALYDPFTINQPRISLAQTPTEARLVEFAGSGTDGVFLYGAQLEVGDIATDYIPTTTTAVSVGMTANVPRLDYSQGSCPALLLEPQRTNLFVQSETFDSASWTKSAVNVTANTTTSPDGTTNADTLTSTATSFVLILQTRTIVSGTTYTTTFYAKQNTQRFIYIRFTSNGTSQNYVSAVFDLQDGTLGETSVGTTSGTLVSATATSSANGFYRITVIASITLTDGNVGIGFATAKTGNAFNSYGAITSAITSGNSLFIYGAQLEQGAYPTSYIPTLGATVTRIADACSKTGISSLIGQSEGTLFFDGYCENSSEIININRSTTNAVFLYAANNNVRAYIYADGTGVNLFSSVSCLTRFKAAVAYKSNDIAFYVNGTLIAQNTSATFTPNVTMENFYIAQGGYVQGKEQVNCNQAIVFPTRLTNSELASITGNQNYTINQAYANYGVASESPNCVLP